MLDLFLVYQFIRRLATPFREWEAYKLGIIDENGNVLRKRKDLDTQKERSAFGAYDVMVLNLKKLIEKVPGGKTRLASYAAALFLIREWNHFSKDSMLNESVSDNQILDSINHFFSDKSIIPHIPEYVKDNMKEDAPTVNVGSGNIAGLGVGPQGEPGLTKKQMDRYKKKNKPLKRFKDIIKEVKKAPNDVCWDDYEMVGFKNKNGKKVPNCVPKE